MLAATSHAPRQPMSPSVVVLREVREALDAGRPVVALETAVVTHGLPAPHHLEAVRSMGRAAWAAGAVPAICLVSDGKLHVGAEDAMVERIALDPHREKASVRDLGSALSRRVNAGLTVSATLFAAHLAGIRAFATGGIGGVHVPAATGDVSTDLMQLSRSSVIVVCSGAKSVLDIPHTLETLESVGVPVFGFRTDRFPAFYLFDSGESVPCLDSPQAAATVARAQWGLGYDAGVVVGNPIPAADALNPAEWEKWIRRARDEAERRHVTGKEVTPFLLAFCAEASEGRTVRANLALLEANARLAGEIAVALAS